MLKKDLDNQILLVDKPLGWSSFDVIRRLKKIAKFKKIGHAGTLDPLASGLLIVATGDKTKQIPLIQAEQKEYIAKFCLGATTPSLDTEFFPTDFVDVSKITREAVENVIKENFIGKILQTPPEFSAVRINGKRAYKLARESKEFEISPKEIEIYNFEVIDFEFIKPFELPYNASLLKRQENLIIIDRESLPVVNLVYFNVKINCSKGTYVRALARDIAKQFNTNGYTLELKRTKIGDCKLDDALNLKQFVDENLDIDANTVMQMFDNL